MNDKWRRYWFEPVSGEEGEKVQDGLKDFGEVLSNEAKSKHKNVKRILGYLASFFAGALLHLLLESLGVLGG